MTSFPPLTAKDFEMEYDGHVYPFFEDEDACLTMYGHDRDEEFAAEATRFDMEIGGLNREDALSVASDVRHLWVVVDDPDEGTLSTVTEDTPNAFPVSVIWR